MSCKEIFEGAVRQQGAVDCPIRMFPKCHPRSHIEIHVDGKRRKIYFSCAKCDRPITTITIRK